MEPSTQTTGLEKALNWANHHKAPIACGVVTTVALAVIIVAGLALAGVLPAGAQGLVTSAWSSTVGKGLILGGAGILGLAELGTVAISLVSPRNKDKRPPSENPEFTAHVKKPWKDHLNEMGISKKEVGPLYQERENVLLSEQNRVLAGQIRAAKYPQPELITQDGFQADAKLTKSSAIKYDHIFDTVYVGTYECLGVLYGREGDKLYDGDTARENNFLEEATRKDKEFRDTHFSFVITVAPKPTDYNNIDLSNPPQGVEAHIIVENIEDKPSSGTLEQLEPHLGRMFTLIDQSRRERRPILVHCSQGQSRSVGVVVAYLMNRCGVKYDEAYAFVKSHRYLAEPNSGLENDLRNEYRTMNEVE